MPWLSVMICSQTAASSGPCTLSSSSARASLSPSPWIDSSGSPARTSSPMPVRAAHTSAIRSARRRRATNPRICAEASSSHCASSTMQTSGCCSATSANSVSVASPTRNRSGAGPALQTEHGRERVALRDGQPVEVIQHRCAELVEAAVGAAPSPTRRQRPSRRASPRHARTRSPAARSCPRRLLREGRQLGSDRRARRPRPRQVPRTPHDVREASSGGLLRDEPIPAPNSKLPPRARKTRGATRGSPWCDRTVEPRRSFLTDLAAGAREGHACRFEAERVVSHELELAGQILVVIGGSSGIGLETARRARDEGADVIITARNADRLHRVGLELGASIAAFDATDFDRLKRFFEELPAPVDHVLVTGPGSYHAPLAEFELRRGTPQCRRASPAAAAGRPKRREQGSPGRDTSLRRLHG